MALMTAQEYVESLRKLNTRVYMFGEKIENWVDHPMIRPSINCVAMTYALAQDPQYADLMTVKSSLTGHTINRFTHLHQSTEDLINKVEQITFSGDYANKVHQPVLYITERAMFELRPEGVTLVEIAPGIDLQTQVLDQMEFMPKIADDLKLMDERIFREELMGLAND